MSRTLLKVLVLLGVMALGVTLSLLLMEGVVRLVAPQPLTVIEPGLYEADPPGRYRLHPGYRGGITNRVEFDTEVSVNSVALRGPELGPRDDARRVMVIGDSFPFGFGVEDDETFVARLAPEAAELGIEVEALNGGLPGTGIPDMAGWFERHGRALEPDLLVLAIFLGNDLADARPDREEIEIVDGLVAPAGSEGGLKSWLYRNSHLFLLAKLAAGSPALQPLRRALGMGDPWVIRNLRHEFAVYAVDPSPVLAAGTAATDRSLARLTEVATQDGMGLAAVLVPDEMQLDLARWEGTVEQLGLDRSAHDPQQPNRVFEEMLSRHGIPFLDLTPILAAESSADEPLYFRRDRHLTPRGHAVTGAALADFLVSLQEPVAESDG